MDTFGDLKLDMSNIPTLDGDAREKAAALRKNGIQVPHNLASELQKPIPSPQTTEWLWWSHFAPRPSARTAPDAYEGTLRRAQEAWDKSDQFVSAQLELRAERAAAAKAEEKAKADADAAQRAQEAAEVKSLLRKRYLSLAGTTEQDFEAAYPTLLADYRREQMAAREREADQGRLALRNAIRSAF